MCLRWFPALVPACVYLPTTACLCSTNTPPTHDKCCVLGGVFVMYVGTATIVAVIRRTGGLRCLATVPKVEEVVGGTVGNLECEIWSCALKERSLYGTRVHLTIQAHCGPTCIRCERLQSPLRLMWCLRCAGLHHTSPMAPMPLLPAAEQRRCSSTLSLPLNICYPFATQACQ